MLINGGLLRNYWSLWYINGPRQANLVLIAYASSEGSGEPAHPRSLARTFAARSYKQWIKRNLQTESQIRGPSEWLGMRGWNLSWRNARRHKFTWRGSNVSIHEDTCVAEVKVISLTFFQSICWPLSINILKHLRNHQVSERQISCRSCLV